MNMLKKGPDIKLPEPKVPDALLDLFYDLRERHLLPLVAVLVVAIVAVPIALSQSSGSGSPRPGAVAALAVSSTSRSHSGELVVAKTTQGLHSYHRRLSYLRAKDPFQQQYPNAESTSAGGSSTTSSGGGSSSESSTSGSSPGTSSAPVTSPQTTSEVTHVTRHLTFFSYAIDVRVVTVGSKNGKASTSKSESQVRRNLPELTVLPSRTKPAVIFMGVTKDGKKALLLVSSSVSSFGEGICVLGSQTCQLLALEPGKPETFVYGSQDRTFRIELLKVHLVVTKKLHLAPLGSHKHGN